MRSNNELRPLSFEIGAQPYAEGSCLIRMGRTAVLCCASLENKVPSWMKGKGTGWLTAEYGMLPRATHTRTDREASKGKQQGRTVEIQRLIGRSLRQALDLKMLGERQITLDCDVLVADGGTRCASITGAWMALALALQKEGLEEALIRQVAAVSAGILEDGDGRRGVILDLDYSEDSSACVDSNVIAACPQTSNQIFLVEQQATGEDRPYTIEEAQLLLELGLRGCQQIMAIQKEALKGL